MRNGKKAFFKANTPASNPKASPAASVRSGDRNGIKRASSLGFAAVSGLPGRNGTRPHTGQGEKSGIT